MKLVKGLAIAYVRKLAGGAEKAGFKAEEDVVSYLKNLPDNELVHGERLLYENAINT